MTERFHRMADSGADAVIAQHTHCIGSEEYYNGAYLLYGQGNFYFHQKYDFNLTKSGLLLEFELSKTDLKVKHHLVHLDDPIVRYDSDRDLSAFYERSKRIKNGETFEKEFSEYCTDCLLLWIKDFRGRNIIDEIMRRILNKEQYRKYLRKNYTDKQAINMLAHVYGDENSEIMIRGLRDFYKER